jgi:hypothetical protein
VGQDTASKVHHCANTHVTVLVYPNAFQYFRYVSKLNDQDYFVAQEFFYAKKELKELLEKGRDYDDSYGFNRIKDIDDPIDFKSLTERVVI